jgi:hypothetical protein
MMIETEVQQIGKFRIVRLSGDLSESDPTVLLGQILASAGHSMHIAIDLGNLGRLPNFLVIPLIAIRNKFQSPDAAITLVNAPSDFRFRLQVAKLDHLFRFIPSLDYLEDSPPVAPEAHSPSNPTTAGLTIKPIIELPGQSDAAQLNPLLKRPVISDVLRKDKKPL